MVHNMCSVFECGRYVNKNKKSAERGRGAQSAGRGAKGAGRGARDGREENGNRLYQAALQASRSERRHLLYYHVIT